MTKNEILLASKMLDLASDIFSRHGCNDVDEKVYEGWSLEERREFVKKFHEYNGDPEEYDENCLDLGDSMLMGYFAHKLKEHCEVLHGVENTKKEKTCENCKHETGRHSIICQSCIGYRHFEPKNK